MRRDERRISALSEQIADLVKPVYAVCSFEPLAAYSIRPTSQSDDVARRSILEDDRRSHTGRQIAGYGEDHERNDGNQAEVAERGEGAERVHDREARDDRERVGQQQLAVEPQQRAGRAAPAEQQRALDQQRAPQDAPAEAVDLHVRQPPPSLP